MADGFGYGGLPGAPYPFWLSSPSPLPVNLGQGGFDPTISHGSYHPSYGGPSLSQTPSSPFYVNNGSFSHRGEDSYTYMLPPKPTARGLYPSRETSDYVPLPTDYLFERQRLDRMPYKFSVSPVESSATLLSSSEPFYKPSGVYASSGSAFDEKRRPGQYHPGHDKFETGVRLGDGRLFPENIQSSLPGSSVEPVNFNVLLGYDGESTGHAKSFSENPDLPNGTVRKTGLSSPQTLPCDSKSSSSLLKENPEGSGVSSLYQTPKTFVADSENGVSETSLKNIHNDLNCDDEHTSWNHFMVSSEGPSAPTMFSMGSESSCAAMKADNGNATQSAANCKTPSGGSANQPSEDVQASVKTTLLSDTGIKGNADVVSTGQLPERHLCDPGPGGLTSSPSSPRASSVVNAMHNLSEVLLYECFNNGSWLKPEQLDNLDKVVENLTKCLKKCTGNKTIAAGEAFNPTHVSSPNVVDLHEASNVFAKDCKGFNVKPLDNFGLKEPVDKDEDETEMTQSIKNILASNLPDGEENHPQTLLYKSLWLETEAALCSTTCMTRYHRIKNEIGNLKLQNREISAQASTFMQEPFLNPQKPVMNNAEQQETTDSLIKHRSISGNDIVTISHDAPQSSRFNSDPVDAVLSLMSRSVMGNVLKIGLGGA